MDNIININTTSTYNKCGEIFLGDTKSYTFLCYYCNELFYEFTEFETHILIHLNSISSQPSTEVIFDSNDSQLEICEINSVDDSLFESQENDLNNCSENDLKEVKLEIENISIELLDDDIVKKEYIKDLQCPNCNILVKDDSHNVAKCLTQKLITEYNGNFIKLLRKGILCCSFCLEDYEDYKKLYDHHIKEEHCSLKGQCIICKFYKYINTEVISKEELNNLLKDESEQKNVIKPQSYQIYCDKCSISLDSKAEYNLHFKLFHNNNTSMRCDSLDKNSECKYKCSLCPKICNTLIQIKIHKKVHTKNRPYKCKLCPLAFSVSDDLKTHAIYNHTDDKPFVSNYKSCDAKHKLLGLERHNEKKHLAIMKSENYQCEICRKNYTSKENLIKHQENIHVDPKYWKYQCPFCDKKFSQKKYLIQHQRIHTGEKPFGCDICNKFFRRKSILIQHKKLHSDERTYECRICEKRFKQVAGYWCHMRRHSALN